MRLKITLILFFIAIILLVSACRHEIDNNNVGPLDDNDDSACDPACGEGTVCVNNTCVNQTECSDCQYFDNETDSCIDYECCDDDNCSDDEECDDHECSKLSCGDCSYTFDHKCKAYACCEDDDCEDDDSSTEDQCKFPGTKSSECVNEEMDTCDSDSDCDDDDASTEDLCVSVGGGEICVYMPITDCNDNDDYCPDGCDDNADNDCKPEADCNKLSCFYNNLDDCDESDFYFSFEAENDTVHMDILMYIEIDGEDGDECDVSMGIDTIDLTFTGDYVNDLEYDDYTSHEIDNMEDDANDEVDDYEGDDISCSYDDTGDLENIFDDWDDGDFWFDLFTCTGEEGGNT